jgi:hypothetical protein
MELIMSKHQSSVHNNLSVLQHLKVASTNLNSKHWYDPISNAIADFLTSTLLIIIVMLCFLAGIASHIEAVFGSWFLAIGFQSVVLLTSVNSDLLPKYKQLPLIAVAMSICTFIFVFLSFDGHLSTGVMLIVNIIKSFAISGVEFIFAYLFVARNNRTKAERAGYQFDLEGNVVTTPFEHNNCKQTNVYEQDKEQDIVREEVAPKTSEIDKSVGTEIEQVIDNIQNTQSKQDSNTEQTIEQVQEPVKLEPKWSRCSCGKTFKSESDYLEHIQTCEVHKWFNE